MCRVCSTFFTTGAFKHLQVCLKTVFGPPPRAKHIFSALMVNLLWSLVSLFPTTCTPVSLPRELLLCGVHVCYLKLHVKISNVHIHYRMLCDHGELISAHLSTTGFAWGPKLPVLFPNRVEPATYWKEQSGVSQRWKTAPVGKWLIITPSLHQVHPLIWSSEKKPLGNNLGSASTTTAQVVITFFLSTVKD